MLISGCTSDFYKILMQLASLDIQVSQNFELGIKSRRADFQKRSFRFLVFIWISIYISIYIYIRVCVCVCERQKQINITETLSLFDHKASIDLKAQKCEIISISLSLSLNSYKPIIPLHLDTFSVSLSHPKCEWPKSIYMILLSNMSLFTFHASPTTIRDFNDLQLT